MIPSSLISWGVAQLLVDLVEAFGSRVVGPQQIFRAYSNVS